MAYGYEIYAGETPKWTEKLPDQSEDVNIDHLHKFFKIMYERQQIWYKRFILKQPAPWTDDVYLRDYKFTNVYRELDRASQWMIKNILLDHSLSISDLIFRIIIFRFYNQPNTFDHPQYAVRLPHIYDFESQETWLETVTYRKMVGNPFHTAYLMNLAFLKKPKDWDGEGLFKDEAYCNFVFQHVQYAIPDIVEALRICTTPEGIIHILEKLPAVSGFQSHEFYLDFCYVAKYWKQPIMKFTENDYTNVGPGASLGLRLIFPSLQPKEQKAGIYTLRDIAEEELSLFSECFKYVRWSKKDKEYIPDNECNITLHQVEMMLCEFSKYWKMTIKEGKQRSKFVAITKVI